MSSPAALERFRDALRAAVEQGTFTKLTLGKYRGDEVGLKNLFVRPVTLKAGPQLSFVYRYATRDVTKNHPPAEAFHLLDQLLGKAFLDAHLFTPVQTFQLASEADGTARLHTKAVAVSSRAPAHSHDREREYLIPANARWLQGLGVTNERGLAREGMAPKFRQINRFVELLSHLTDEAVLPTDRPFRVLDMGCGKGYLTFATAAFFGARASVVGIEARPELVTFCNDRVRRHDFNNLRFVPGSIVDASAEPADVIIALHACDTATDDALAKGIEMGAALLVVSPCCQKELRPQLRSPSVLAGALKHGIFQERQAEFVTDALRSQLLEWAGYRTKVFEFVSTEHTAKNLMIAGIKTAARGELTQRERLSEFAGVYGIRTQRGHI